MLQLTLELFKQDLHPFLFYSNVSCGRATFQWCPFKHKNKATKCRLHVNSRTQKCFSVYLQTLAVWSRNTCGVPGCVRYWRSLLQGLGISIALPPSSHGFWLITMRLSILTSSLEINPGRFQSSSSQIRVHPISLEGFLKFCLVMTVQLLYNPR